MALNDDSSAYKLNKQAYLDKLEYFSMRLDDVEKDVDDLLFDIKQDGSEISEEELAQIPSEKIEGISSKNRELAELLKDTKKVMKIIKKLEGKKRAYNAR